MWKDFIYNNQKTDYECSDSGQIRNKITGNILKQTLGKTGYYHCWMKINNEEKTLDVHRVVALSFLKNPNNYKVVNHKDGNKKNNRVSNLEWCSYRDNSIHAWENGLYNNTSISVPVLQYSLDGSFIKEWPSFYAAKKGTGINKIYEAAIGTRKTAGGFVWKPKKDNYLPVKEPYKIKVKQFSKDGSLIQVFESISSASRKTGISRKGIGDCCNGKLKTSGGFVWKSIR